MIMLSTRGFVSNNVCGNVINGQRSAVARYPIPRDELVAAWAGEIVTLEYVHELGTNAGKTVVQIDEGLYLASEGSGPADWINHSCDPNLGLRGQIVLVAMRPIAAGEELCLDYAMADGSSYDEFNCACGATTCRHRITGDDWQRPELQRRYAGYFSPYLANRIALMRRAA